VTVPVRQTTSTAMRSALCLVSIFLQTGITVFGNMTVMESRGTGHPNTSCAETTICNKQKQQTKGPVQYLQMLRLLETKEIILSPQKKKIWNFMIVLKKPPAMNCCHS